MPAADPASRGPRRNAKNMLREDAERPTRQLKVSEVVEAQELVELLEDLHEDGIGLSCSRTKEGGTLAWGFLMGGKPVMKYTADRGQWLALLESLS